MEDLLSFIVENILKTTDFEIEDIEDDGKIHLTLKIPEDKMGLLIGKDGNTVKAIQNLLRVKARLENKLVYLNVQPKLN